MTKRCICEICTCGRHRCPHRPAGVINKGDKSCMVTEYANRFIPKNIERAKPFKPQERPHDRDGVFDDNTTNRIDYTPKKGDRPQFRAPDVYKKPYGDMDTTTSYTKDFIPKKLPLTKAIKPDGNRQVVGKFEGSPTYKNDYRKWDVAPREKHGDNATWQAPQQPFEGSSTMRRDFRGYNEPPRQSMKPSQSPNMSDEPFDDRTGYKATYIPHAMPEKHMREERKWSAPRAPFQGLSTQKRDFTPKQSGRQTSCKPDFGAYQSEAPFEGDTTQRIDFTKWPAERPFHHEHERYVKPDGRIDFGTTSGRAFTPKQLQRTVAWKPAERREVPADFNDSTTHKDDFRKWQVAQRSQPVAQSKYKPPSAPFEGTSTFRAHYDRKQADPSRSCKPNEMGYRSDAPFEDNTMYKNEFTPKKVEPCPAVSLDGGLSNKYIFSDTDPRGHKYFQPVRETLTSLPTGLKRPGSNTSYTMTGSPTQKMQPLAVN